MNLSYDQATGAYVGGSAIGGETAHAGLQILGHIEYLGYARRTNAGTTWDLGVINTNITEYYDRHYIVNNSEIYAGLMAGHFRYYVYYSPHYFSKGVDTVYVDFSGTFRPARRWRLFGHIGVLTPLDGPGGRNSFRETYDFRAGIAAAFKGGELQLAWTTRRPDLNYPAAPAQKRDALVLGATYVF